MIHGLPEKLYLSYLIYPLYFFTISQNNNSQNPLYSTANIVSRMKKYLRFVIIVRFPHLFKVFGGFIVSVKVAVHAGYSSGKSVTDYELSRFPLVGFMTVLNPSESRH